MADPKTQLYSGNAPLPVKIELYESSGPVSPRYQYFTHVIIKDDGANIHLSYDDKGNYQDGKPTHHVNFKKDLPRERYEKLWEELFKQDLEHLGQDAIGDKRNRVGVSFNHFEVSLGDHLKVRFDYLLSHLKSGEFAKQNAVVDLLKGLKDQAPGATT